MSTMTQLGKGESAQGTAEYALILGVFMAVVIGLGALWDKMDAGVFIVHALSSASHHIGGAGLRGLYDMLLF